MKKTEVEKKLKSLAKKMQKTFLEYLDSLEEEGNEVGKKEGYLAMAIFRESIHFNSTREDTELKEENQIDWHEFDK